jgi:tRNA(Arg) A34 adenosine deaminase TadA
MPSNALVANDESLAKPKLVATTAELFRLLEVIEKDIFPITLSGVAMGNKVFGAAVLDKSLEQVICADTNTETTCPLFHGEVKVIYEWSKLIPAPERGPAAKSSIFLATHEPCCMCIASILWSGFTKVFYLFPYALTSAQGIPHDIDTMHELWGVDTYRKQNRYCSTACLMTLVDELEEDNPDKPVLQEKIQRLVAMYDELSHKYHAEKANNPNNSLVLD